MEERFGELRQHLGEIEDLRTTSELLFWDQTVMMPPAGGPVRAEQLTTLQRISHELFVSDEIGALLEELRRVAERGWAQTLEEGARGAASVAAPVHDEDGQVIAAVSVVGPISRARQALPRHRAAVIDAARLISTRIGYALTGD